MVKKQSERNRERTLVVTALFLWPVVWFDLACIQTESQRELTDIFNVYLSIRYLLLCTCIVVYNFIYRTQVEFQLYISLLSSSFQLFLFLISIL